MTGIPQNQLERVFARCQFQCGFRLATTEVQVVFIRRQTIGQLIRAILSLSKGRAVDQQVVVAGVFLSVPAGATPMPRRPKTTVTGEDTISPSLGDTK